MYTADWLSDTDLGKCADGTRGIWADAVCHMERQGGNGRLSGTVGQLAQICRTTPERMMAAIEDLRSTGAANIEEDGQVVTLVNRRMAREFVEKDQAVQRQRKHRETVKPERVTVLSRRSHTPSSAATASSSSSAAEEEVSSDSFQKTTERIQETFPGTDRGMVARIVAAATAARPGVGDREICEALRVTSQDRQRSAGLWLTTLPAYLASTSRSRASPKCKLCSDTGRLASVVFGQPDEDCPECRATVPKMPVAQAEQSGLFGVRSG